MRQITASEFAANCPALLDEVARTGEEITILKDGKPIARLMPVQPASIPSRYPQDELQETVVFVGDILEPVWPLR